MRPALRAVRVAVLFAACAVAPIPAHAQDQFARDYMEGETAYQNGDWKTAEEKFQASLNSPDAPKSSRGSRVRLVSQQYGYYPEYYLALTYAQLGRYDLVLKYAAAAKKYVKKGDPVYLTLVSIESLAKNPPPIAGPGDTRGPIFSGETPAAATGPAYALVIGIDHYDDSAFPTLKTAISDATAVGEILRDRYGFETTVLLDATRREIVTALDDYRRTIPDTGSLLIYYAGHGYYDKDADRASWLPKDAEQSVTANWIEADTITSEIRAVKARHVIVISDSCYSGGLTREATANFTEADHDAYVRRVSVDRSRTLLSSGALEPVADGGGGPNHSVFTSALLKGLTSMPADDFTGLELFRDYIAVSVAGRSQQSPQYLPIQDSGHDEGDFVFRRKRVP